MYATQCVLPSDLEQFVPTAMPTSMPTSAPVVGAPAPKRKKNGGMRKKKKKATTRLLAQRRRKKEPRNNGNRGRTNGGSSTSNIEAYTCGCCDPLLETSSYPAFCGGRICEANPTPCQRPARRQLGMMKNGGMRKKKDRTVAGVTICAGGLTLCVDELEPQYLSGTTPYDCGPCVP